MMSGEVCEYCKRWTLTPCKNADDADDCPNNDTEPENARQAD